VKFNDAVSGAVLLALALAVLINIQSFPKIPGQNIGPGAFPGLLATLLAGCAVLLIIKGLRARVAKRDAWFTAGDWLAQRVPMRNFIVTVACLVFYIVASEWLGFIPCAIIVQVAMFLTLGVPRKLILPIAIVVALVIHTVFYRGLRVPLPWGLLLPVAW
jgi:putative tricarboxylic transport membrane protein